MTTARDVTAMTLEEELELAELTAACRRTWPRLDVAPATFAAHVMARRPPDLPTLGWLLVVHREDLYLACACLHGCATAVRAFHGAYGADLDGILGDRRAFSAALLDGPRAKIATYTGRAPLRRWLRVVAERLALESSAPVGDDITRARYREEYPRALAELAEHDRAVLAQFHVDRLTIDELGALYGVHRSTASRWIVRAEDELRGRMLARLPGATHLVRSQLSLSLAQLG
ncbi:MAG: hypothetical protein KF773_06620 [Deltaproteobacteria bacterium]|nr:hypothetical protein [Deltaproteobacteria bacterium]